jgi:hypothetical protein
MVKWINDAELFYQMDYVPHLKKFGSHRCHCLTCGFHDKGESSHLTPVYLLIFELTSPVPNFLPVLGCTQQGQHHLSQSGGLAYLSSYTKCEYLFSLISELFHDIISMELDELKKSYAIPEEEQLVSLSANQC